jgi:hypothetical protein
MTGVVYILLVSPVIDVPPVDAVYHRYCPAEPPVALSVMAAEPHEEFPVVLGAVGMVLMVAVTDVLVLSQVPLLMLT